MGRIRQIPRKRAVEFNALLEMIDNAEWTEARTFKEVAPHEYVLQPKNPKLYNVMKYIVARYGFIREFRLWKTVRKYRYFYIGEYSYWIDGHVLNRCRLDGSFIRL